MSIPPSFVPYSAGVSDPVGGAVDVMLGGFLVFLREV